MTTPKDTIISSTSQTPRSRSKSGCSICRSRRVKCDQTHPICLRCVSRGDSCYYIRCGGGATSTGVSQMRAEKETRSTASPLAIKLERDSGAGGGPSEGGGGGSAVEESASRSLGEITVQQGRSDAVYLQQFRNVVWPRLVQFEPPNQRAREDKDNKLGISLGSNTDVIEEVAALFPPLYHAIMATSALSMTHQLPAARIDALQHYQASLPILKSCLRSATDLSWDGCFLTHFFFLVYELRSTSESGSGSSNMSVYSQHLAMLLKISLLRRQILNQERFPFVVWWICTIDWAALLTGSSSGEYVDTMLKRDLIPPPQCHLYPIGPYGTSVVFGEERESLSQILQLNYEVTLLAVRVGLLARELRQDAAFDVRLRQARIFELRESLRAVCASQSFLAIKQAGTVDLPRRSILILSRARALSAAMLIYSHTSMWETQRMDMGPIPDQEVAQCATQILGVAQTVTRKGLPYRCLVFPLFMAGFASLDGWERSEVLGFLAQTEEGEGVDEDTAGVRKALEAVYQRQNDRFMGHSWDFGWLDIMGHVGGGVLGFGL